MFDGVEDVPTKYHRSYPVMLLGEERQRGSFLAQEHIIASPVLELRVLVRNPRYRAHHMHYRHEPRRP